MINISMASKNLKTSPKKLKSTRIQKSTRVQICFFMTFKCKKTPNMNSFNQIESFDTNSVHFGGQNRYQ
jgi:hypothetical protein